ncbi:hypothetical protein L218DRAFT_965099 [Marasmius fiardii PR-910]|nr:hypothetical protein L218DRAFT_965099 [Marasmius fiardii PR-910]
MLDTGGVLITRKRIKFGGENLRPGGFIKVSLPTADVDQLMNKRFGSSVFFLFIRSWFRT